MVYTMSQYTAMSASDGFSNFVNNQPTSAASTSGNSSESTSPPCLRMGEMQAPFGDNPHQSNGLLDDDALVDDDVLDGCLQSNAPDSKSQSNFHPYAKNQPKLLGLHSSKLKATTAERRATHNAIERARRESLNGRFLELARALPTMHNVKRPSKSVIVNKSLEWICESQVREYDLARENAFLRNHVNELRAQLQMEPLPLNRSLANQSQVPYKIAGVHSQGGATIDSACFNTSAPYPLPCHQPLAVQHPPHGFVSKQRPLTVSTTHEGQASSPTQPGDKSKPVAAPFCTPHPQGQRYLASNLYETSDGSAKTIEQFEMSRSQSFGPPPNDENISSIYFPGLSIHTELSSPFQTLSESDGLLSTAGSSPPRLRYFSSSGSSDASDKSPSHLDYPNAPPHFEADRKPLNEVACDRINPGTLQVGILGGPGAPANHQHGLQGQPEPGVNGTIRPPHPDAPLQMGPKLGCNSDFDRHVLPVQRHPSHSMQFPPSNYVGSLHATSEVFDENHRQVPRGSLVGGASIDSSMLAGSSVANPGAPNEMPASFPLGSAWVWG